jgi:hypothetical protein
MKADSVCRAYRICSAQRFWQGLLDESQKEIAGTRKWLGKSAAGKLVRQVKEKQILYYMQATKPKVTALEYIEAFHNRTRGSSTLEHAQNVEVQPQYVSIFSARPSEIRLASRRPVGSIT